MRSAWLLVVAVLLAVAGASHASAAPVQQHDCPAVLAAFMSGTGEGDERSDPTVPVGMLADTANGLRKQFGDDVQVVFPASPRSAFNKGLSYSESKSRGDAALRAVLAEFAARCPSSQVTVTGYSQGADSAGDVASSIGCKSDPIPAARVMAVGLVSDPRQGTAGGTVVGPKVDGTGISGPRPDGFCALSSVVAQFCDPGDKYCSTDAAKNPLIAGLGRMLNPESGGDTPGLATDFTGADPEGLERDVAAAAGGSVDAAGSALSTLRPLAEVSRWAEGNQAAREGLRSAPAGSPQQQAGGVLDTLASMDVAGAVSSLESVGKAATPLLSGQVAPLTATPSDQLSTAVSVLGVLKPETMIGQVTNVVTNSVELAVNLPQVLDRLNRIGPIVLGPDTPAGKVDALHVVFGELNNLFRPLVIMAAGVDLHMVSSVLQVLGPLDVSGAVSLAAVVVGLLGNIDVVGIARQFGQLQDNVWGLARAVAAGDLVGAGAALVGLIPTVLGFASLAVNALTSGTKTDVSELGALPAAAGKLATTQDATALGDLVSEGVDALKFFTSGAHQSYGSVPVDSSGRSALKWLLDWLTARIDRLVSR